MPLILGAQSAVATGFSVDNSSRWNTEGRMERNFTAGNPDIWTFSVWLKRGIITANYPKIVQAVDPAVAADNADTGLQFRTNDILDFGNWNSGDDGTKYTDAMYRDTSAWYHVVTIYDSTESVAGDRIQIWVNGVRITSFGTSTDPSLNQDTNFNKASPQCTMHLGGHFGRDSTGRFNGYMAEVAFVDGTAYTASDFGEFNEDSPTIWQPKDFSGDITFGTNGLYLDFKDAANLGNDVSGNNNDLTEANFTAEDQCVDSPTNNFATMNINANYWSNMTFTEGNTTVKSDHPAPALSTIGLTKGKWYLEAKAITSTSGNDWQIGIVGDQVVATSDEIGNHAKSWAYYGADGDYINNNGGTSYGDSYGYAIIGVALDLDNNKLYFAKDGVWQDSGDPTSGATGTGAISISAAADAPLNAYFIACGANASANDYTWKMNFGNPAYSLTSAVADGNGYGQFEYAPPSGYLAICTKNLATDGG